MKNPKALYYITHKDNLKSILKNGILSHSKSRRFLKIFSRQKIKSIHDKGIIQGRKEKTFKNRSLWEYANVYFQARNPMLYRVLKEYRKESIIVLKINSDVINSPGAGITDGNAASQKTQLFEDIDQGLNTVDKDLFKETDWRFIKDGKRKIMAEVLIPDQIPKEKIIGIYTASQNLADEVRKQHSGALNIMPYPYMFFLPEYEKPISDRILLRKGDMFLSEMQTFTISVNVVGVMGKGLASTAKYQFPDVYVRYQDLCRQKKIKMGIPYLHKRTENYEKTLMEETSSTTEDGERWFLLFATKNHWREKSPYEGIEKGLQWLVQNYKKQGIQSLALPALGCGLGGLSWKDMGPLMCKYLNQMDIKSSVYLPLETKIPTEWLEPQFLLPKN